MKANTMREHTIIIVILVGLVLGQTPAPSDTPAPVIINYGTNFPTISLPTSGFTISGALFDFYPAPFIGIGPTFATLSELKGSTMLKVTVDPANNRIVQRYYIKGTNVADRKSNYT